MLLFFLKSNVCIQVTYDQRGVNNEVSEDPPRTLTLGGRHPPGTCVPSGPIWSRAPTVLDRKRMIFRKLSSPILQEPSTRKTRSALAALHTGQEEEEEERQ